MSDQQQQPEYDDDPLFNADEAARPAPLPEELRNQLNDVHSQLDPDVSERILRIGDSLNNDEVNRIQPVNPDPNEDQPIRRVSVFKQFTKNPMKC